MNDHQPEINYATKGKRFLNFLLDNVLFLLLHFIHVLLLGTWLTDFLGNSFWANFSYFVVENFLYLFIFELAFNRTLGKFITGTKVVNEQLQKPSFQAILIRNLCRFIPFDALSFLFAHKGWHDAISKTEVINT